MNSNFFSREPQNCNRGHGVFVVFTRACFLEKKSPMFPGSRFLHPDEFQHVNQLMVNGWFGAFSGLDSD